MGKNYNSCFDYKLMQKTVEALEGTANSIHLESFAIELESVIEGLRSYDKTHSVLERNLDNLSDYISKIKSSGNELSNLCTGIQQGIKAYNDAEGDTQLFLGTFADTIEKYIGNKTVAGYLRNDEIVNKDTFATSRNDFLDNVSEETQLFISQYAMNQDQNCPSEYKSAEDWKNALIEKYQSLGYSSYDANDLAAAEMAKWRIAQTGAKITGTAISVFATENFDGLIDTVKEEYDNLVTKYKEQGYSEEQAKKLASLESEYNDALKQTETPNDFNSSAQKESERLRNELDKLKEDYNEYNELFNKYKEEGYSDKQAQELAEIESEYNDVLDELKTPNDFNSAAQMKAEKLQNQLEKLKEAYKPSEENLGESNSGESIDSSLQNENAENEVTTGQSSSNSKQSTVSKSTNNTSSNISYRVEESQTTSTTNSPPSYQSKVETPSPNTPTDNNTQQTPSDNTNSNNTANNDNGSQSGNSSNSGDSGNSSSQERPNTGDNTDNSNNTANSNNSNAGNNNNSNTGNNNNSNAGNSNNNNNNTENGTEEIPTPPTTGDNTGTNPGNENNGGIINTTPPGNTGTGNTNNSNPNYSSGNNTGNNYGNNEPTIIPNPGTGNNNAATTTPSAPDSDAGIIDNSGETLDVISIDKDSSKTQPSTTSNDGGSVIPVILGVGAAGAAAVAGAKFIHDKKEKENTYTYDDDSSTDNTNFSYESSENEQESSEDPYDAVMQPNTKYKAGNVNKLVLDDAPTDLNIRNDIPDNNTKEELE